MKKTIISLLAAAALMGCATDENKEGAIDNGLVPIQLSAGMGIGVSSKAPINPDSNPLMTFTAGVAGWEAETAAPDYATEAMTWVSTAANIEASTTAKSVTLNPTQYYNAEANIDTYIRAWYPEGKVDETAKTVTFSTSYPVGTVIEMNGFKNSNIAPQVQVTGVSEDGTTLYVTADPSRFPDMEIEASKDWSLDASSYYQGSSLSTEKMISENQSITFDINGGDSVFEKIFRALGEIAQGNLVDTTNPLEGETGDVNTTLDRITEALDLIQSAIYSSGLDSSENNSDIYTVVAKINSNTVVMNNVQETQKEVQANLENSIYSLKNVDQTEAAIKALMASNNLSASYACLNQVMNVSLLNYL